MSKRILGISAYYHDAAAAVIVDGVVVAAAQEERFTRRKHDPSFPSHAVRFCLRQAGCTMADLDAVVFYDKPWLKFERLLETYYQFAPRGLRQFCMSMPVWIKEKLFSRRNILKELAAIDPVGAQANLLFSSHHLSHAASAYYPSPFQDAAVLTIDGVGEWATASIGKGDGATLTILKELRFPHSLGLLYSAFTYYLGFRVNSGEYKLMGLSPYGDPASEAVRAYKEAITRTLISVKDDGSLFLDQTYFDYATGLTMVHEKRWEALFGIPRRLPESALLPEHCNLALAIQQVTEEIVIKLARTAQALTGSKNLCLAGGVALNCVANARIARENIFEQVWVQPAAGDAGGALGAALAVYYASYGGTRAADGTHDAMQGSYLGPALAEGDILQLAERMNAPYTVYRDDAERARHIAARIDQGQVIGWCQGRMEFGPRSLGNRSILGDARSPDMQKRMNLKIKFRESFRPFAPSVRMEDAAAYFDMPHSMPYMLFTTTVRQDHRVALPENYHARAVREKLYFNRSDIPAVTHLDYSARVQTVHQETNPRYWALLKAFKELTGCGVVVNTSFNVRGEPIVCTPEDAYRCFMRTEMDCLVLGDYVFDKKEQPVWQEGLGWKQDLILD